MSRQRVIVIGAGVTGVTTAYALLADGHEVVLLDAAPVAASGASHANGGFLSAAFCAPWAAPGMPRQALGALLEPEAPFRFRPDGTLAQWRWLRLALAQCTGPQFARNRQAMVRLALASRRCLEDVIVATGVQFERRQRGVLQLFREAPGPALREARSNDLRGYGFDAEWCDAASVYALEPALARTAPVAAALHVRDDGNGDCAAFVQQLLDWCVAHGLQYVPNTAVDRLDIGDRGQGGARRLRAVHAGTTRWEADTCVVAAGVASATLLRPYLRLPLQPVKGYSITATVAPERGPQCAIIDDSTKLAVVRLGNRVRIAGMAEIVGHDLRVNPARCDLLVRQYESLYGPLQASDRSDWAGLRPATPHGVPLIGATPIGGLFVNTGQGAFGWTMACGSARLLADLLAQRSPALDPAPYALPSH